ncbi:MAG: GNAT family N-acetyltransferase [Myxococcota bacterium]|nr:GNAT family N-acetyltransferase [Myxococcota bacterium]
MSEHRCVDEAERLRDEWRALWASCPSATPFQSPDWVLAWMRFLPVSEPRLIAIRAGGHLVGVAPTFRWDSGSCRTISLLGAGISDYLDIVAAPGFETAILDAFTAWLESCETDWDRCSFDEIGPRALLRDLRPPRCTAAALQPQSVCPAIALPMGATSLDGVVPPLQMKRVRRDGQRAASLGAVSFERADVQEAAPILDVLFALHARRWQTRGTAGVLADGRLRELHGEVAAAFQRLGMLRLYVLRIGSQVGAVIYGFRWRERLYFYLQGIEPELARASPGTLLVAAALRDALDEDVSVVDFLRGAESYKYTWGAVDQSNDSLRIDRSGELGHF